MATYVVKKGQTLNDIAKELGYTNFQEAGITSVPSGNFNLLNQGDVINYNPSGGQTFYKSLDLTQKEPDITNKVIESGINKGMTYGELDKYQEEHPETYSPENYTTGQYVSPQKTSTQIKAEQEKLKKTQQQSQISPLTSYQYNPDVISGIKKATDNFQIRLNDIKNTPFSGIGTKTDAMGTQLLSTANELSKNWTSTENFLKDFTTNPEVQKNLQSYFDAGGTKEKIIQNIEQNIQPDLSNVSQTTADYMATLTPTQKQVFETIAPEYQTTQQEIMRQHNIPKELQNVYFGTPDKIGILEKQILEAKEAKRIIEQKEIDEKTNFEAKAKLLKDKNNADVNIQLGNIEKNRLSAKNYMTGMLAKLGALNTTSASADALTILDEKYQAQSTELQSKLTYTNTGLDLDLNNDLNTLKNNVDEKINTIEQDLSKDSNDIIKEILKEKQNSDKEIYQLTSKYQTLFRTQTEKYIKEAKTLAEKNIKDSSQILSGGIDLKSIVPYSKEMIATQPTTIKLTSSQKQIINASQLSGDNVVNYFLTLPKAFQQKWQQDVISNNQPSIKFSLKAVQTEYNNWLKSKTILQKFKTSSVLDTP